MRTAGIIALAAAIISCWAGLPARAQSDPAERIRRCSAEEDSVKRLACYDAIALEAQGRANAAAAATLEEPVAPDAATKAALAARLAQGVWDVRVDKSKIDDTTTVVARVDAAEVVNTRFEEHRPTLILRCMENTTAAYINFDGAFVADSGGYGSVTFRVDQGKAFERSLSESTDNRALGMWSGGSAIPFIKSLFGAKRLLVRATPYNESDLTFEFPIAGIEAVIDPLRKACGW